MMGYADLEFYAITNDQGEIEICCAAPSGEIDCARLDLDNGGDEEAIADAILLACAEALIKLQEKGAIP